MLSSLSFLCSSLVISPSVRGACALPYTFFECQHWFMLSPIKYNIPVSSNLCVEFSLLYIRNLYIIDLDCVL